MPFVGLVGCGNLGSSIVKRWLDDGLDPQLIKVVDIHPKKVESLGLKACTPEDLSVARMIILTVKPSDMKNTIASLKISEGALIVSMAAGISMKNLTEMLPENQPICRVMPNLAVRIGKGILATYFNEYVDQAHKQHVKKIFEPLGKTIELNEKNFDAVTALAGSGPAFVSSILEACVLGGIAGGLSKELSEELTLNMFSATVEMIKHGMSFEELRFRVSSPAGTTIAGIEILESEGVRGSIIKSLRVASERSFDLGKQENRK